MRDCRSASRLRTHMAADAVAKDAVPTGDTIPPGSPVLWLSSTKGDCVPAQLREPPHLADADKSFQTRSRPLAGMRQSAVATFQSPTLLEDSTAKESLAVLRKSDMAATDQRARMITTMENADVDAMIVAIAAVVRAYTRDASRKRFVTPRDSNPVFDEAKFPLTADANWKLVPRANTVESFVRQVTIALELDESSLVIALILLERAMEASTTPLLLSSRNWRPALLIAIIVASKVVYDEKVFLADYRDQLPQFRLDNASAQEATFLGLIGYNTTVRRGQYARYYYALEVRFESS